VLRDRVIDPEGNIIELQSWTADHGDAKLTRSA
jgi:hypothetical protein